jgi:2-polyprenyl-3-methyl-5-hydroxy-6-metoxy-1,4-benzoquinol methylase
VIPRAPLRDALLTNYKDGQGTLSSGSVYKDIGAFWPHFDANYAGVFDGLARSARVLDVGCGPGSLLAWLASKGFTELHGVDLSPDDVRFAAAHLGPDVVVLDDARSYLAARPGAHDVIVMKALLEHVPKAELLPLLEAVSDALAPEGFVVIEVPNMDWLMASHERYMDLTHEVGFTRESLEALLQLVFGHVTVTASALPEQTRSQRLFRPLLLVTLRRLLYILGEGASDMLFAHRSLIARAHAKGSARG